MNIVVLCGGTSTEREVSLSSSEKIAKALRSKGHMCLPVDVFWGLESMPAFDNSQDIDALIASYRALSPLTTRELKEEREFFGPNVIDICRRADIVFLGLHGENGEDGKVQAAFDLLHIKYTGSGCLPSAVAMSKAATKAILSGKIPMPAGTVLEKGAPKRPLPAAPCVVKPSNGGSSIGVVIVKDERDLEGAVRETFGYDDTVLIEEFIDGLELTQGVLGGEALPPVEILPEGNYDYTNKYNGKTQEICPARISGEVLREMSEYSVSAGRILGLSVYYRLDYLLDKNGKLFCLEVNTLPGMTETSLVPREAKAAGMEYEDLCERIVELSLQKYERVT